MNGVFQTTNHNARGGVTPDVNSSAELIENTIDCQDDANAIQWQPNSSQHNAHRHQTRPRDGGSANRRLESSIEGRDLSSSNMKNISSQNTLDVNGLKNTKTSNLRSVGSHVEFYIPACYNDRHECPILSDRLHIRLDSREGLPRDEPCNQTDASGIQQLPIVFQFSTHPKRLCHFTQIPKQFAPL